MDAFGVHLSAGLVGGIATGFFATDDVVTTPQVGLLQVNRLQKSLSPLPTSNRA